MIEVARFLGAFPLIDKLPRRRSRLEEDFLEVQKGTKPQVTSSSPMPTYDSRKVMQPCVTRLDTASSSGAKNRKLSLTQDSIGGLLREMTSEYVLAATDPTINCMTAKSSHLIDAVAGHLTADT
jgi:hypothetical protein